MFKEDNLEGVLRAVYPDYSWDTFKFYETRLTRPPGGFWNNEDNLMQALQRAEEKIGIKEVLLPVLFTLLSLLPFFGSPRTGMASR